MPDQLTPLQAALVRGLQMAKGGEDPRIQSYSPPPNDMYRIILAAVLNLHEAVMQRLGKLEEQVQQILMLGPDDAEPPSLASSGPKLVDKPCAKCGEMMLQVHPSRKYHENCKEAK